MKLLYETLYYVSLALTAQSDTRISGLSDSSIGTNYAGLDHHSAGFLSVIIESSRIQNSTTLGRTE